MGKTATVEAYHVLRNRMTRFWREMRQTLRGEEHDYTRGPLLGAVLLLAIPMVLEMCMESIFGVVDIYFVGRLGPEAVAAVGITESILTLVFATAVGLSSAAAAMVARRIGEGRTGDASKAAAQAIFLGGLASVATAGVGFFYAEELLRLMGATDATIAIGAGYTRITFLASITIYLLFLINAIFRGAGNPALSMRVLAVANLVNIILDPLLIFGWGPFPELGLEGAAIATALGRGSGVLYQLVLLFGPRGQIRVSVIDLRPMLSIIRGLVRVGWPGMLQFLISTASWLFVVRILANFGDAPLAGYTIALRIVVFAILPSWGLCSAAGTLVGQNLGAGKVERAEKAVWLTGFINMLLMSSISGLFLWIAPTLIGLFSDDPEVIRHGVDNLIWMSFSFPFMAYGMVASQGFNGAGDTVTPMWMNVGCYWLWQLPLAWVLAVPAGYGPLGVFMALGISEATRAMVGVFLFRRGTWKTRQI